MKIIVAEHSGACWGVKRALQIAFDTSSKNDKRNVYTFGPLIHNPQVVSKLKDKGIEVLEDVDNLKKDSTVIIRTHGISPVIRKKMNDKELNITDATCPNVDRSHKIIESLSKEGYKIVIIGEKKHPEVKGLLGYAKRAYIVNSYDDVIRLPYFKKCGVLGQTTITFEHFKKIISYLLLKTFEIRIYNTLCSETKRTQDATLKLSKIVDIMIIIGGKNSANTKHLVELCEPFVDTCHIEDAKDIKKEWLKNKETVGISAGASTPDWIVKEVIEYINKNV